WIGNTPLFKALDLLRPYTFDELSIKQVSRLVNSVKNDSEEILEVDET
ncbi:MAG: hypothetical protein ISR90_04240, partial [Candidatus Marinimicrobia bacterium]|nr:hypothetical protein [Candidatus Neomarinimicrobiota bacterium]